MTEGPGAATEGPGAAFFDLDRTLLTGSSAFFFGKACYRAGLLPWHRLLRDAAGGLVFKLFGASDETSQALRDRILGSVAGHRADTFRELAPSVVEDLLPRIRPEAHTLLELHEQAGRDVWIVSASPVEIVAELARALGLTGGLGTASAVADGVYTGELAGPFCYGEGKAEVIRAVAAERGYDLAACYSYSDSASDLPMMQLVGNPIAVNPDRSMMAVAHRRGWPIIELARTRKLVLGWSAAGSAAVATGVTGYVAGRLHQRRRDRVTRRAQRAMPW